MSQPELKHNEHSSTIKQEIELFHAQVTENLHVMKRISTRTASASNWKNDRVTRDIKEGFVDDANLERLIRGDAVERVSFVPDLLILNASQREFIKREGFLQFFQEDAEHDPLIQENKLDAFIDETWGVDDIHVLYTYSNEVRRLDGTPIPVAKYGDYIDAGLHDGKYDLEKAVEILSKRDDVRLLVEQFSNSQIHDVPGYNRGEYSRRYIKIVYSAPEEIFPKLVEGRNFWRRVFEMDALGLRAGGAALFDDFSKVADEDDDCDNDGASFGM